MGRKGTGVAALHHEDHESVSAAPGVGGERAQVPCPASGRRVGEESLAPLDQADRFDFGQDLSSPVLEQEIETAAAVRHLASRSAIPGVR